MALYTIKNLNFSYSNATVETLTQVSFKVKQGEFIVLAGATGSGKTTLLRLLKPELAPTGKCNGEIYYEDHRLTELTPLESVTQIGFVQQQPENQIVTNRVWAELAFGLENLGLDPLEIRSRVGEIAHFFGIQRWFHRKVEDLSGGEKQILNLAATVIMRPKVLLLDEPTASLDPLAATNFIQMLVRLNQELNTTIIVAEHRLEELLVVADRLLVLERGKLSLDMLTNELTLEVLENKMPTSLILNLPASLQLAYELKLEEELPLNVKAGLSYLSKYFSTLKEKRRENQPQAKQDVVASLKDISFRYERQGADVLSDLDFTLAEGEIVALVGGNGTGKSTLLKLIAGLLTPYQGKVTFKGQSRFAKRGGEHQLRLAYLPQNPRALFLGQTVLADFQLMAQQQGISSSSFAAWFARIESEFQLVELAPQHPFDLSGGEMQRVALAKILSTQPDLILLDEPTKGLDGGQKRNLEKRLKNLAQSGKTVLLVTHDLDFAAEVASRCGLFFDGQVISTNTPALFFSQNYFYTTAASRLSRPFSANIVTNSDLISACQLGQRRFE